MAKEIKKPRVRINLQRDVPTHSEVWHGAKIVHAKAVDDPRGSQYVFMSALILYAFTVEAYTNTVGPDLFPDSWTSGEDRLERKAPLEKISLIATRVGVTLDRRARPWQTLKTLFRVRNWLAHGKVLPIRIERVVPYNPERQDYLDDPFVQGPWAEFCNDVFATRARADIKALLKTLHDANPTAKDHLFSFGVGAGSASFEQADGFH